MSTRSAPRKSCQFVLSYFVNLFRLIRLNTSDVIIGKKTTNCLTYINIHQQNKTSFVWLQEQRNFLVFAVFVLHNNMLNGTTQLLLSHSQCSQLELIHENIGRLVGARTHTHVHVTRWCQHGCQAHRRKTVEWEERWTYNVQLDTQKKQRSESKSRANDHLRA